ncbi:hypothetical protein V6Z12_A10G206900 [Gossypium hirsutum]
MKLLFWNCRWLGNPAIVRDLKQLLVANDPDVIFLCKTKLHSNKIARVHDQCCLDGCLAINSVGKSGGLAMLWKEGPKLDNSKLFAAPYGLGDSAGRPDIF